MVAPAHVSSPAKPKPVAKAAPAATPATADKPEAARPAPAGDRFEIAPKRLEAPRPAAATGALEFSTTATPELKAVSADIGRSVKATGDGTFTMSGADYARNLERARAIPDPVQKDLVVGALEKMKAQGAPDEDGNLTLGNDRIARLVDGSTPARYEAAAKAAAADPLLKRYDKPGMEDQKAQMTEFMVRYATDPVFDATIHKKLVRSGGVTNAAQMVLGGDRKLHAIDKYFGQCNELQQRSGEIMKQFTDSWTARHGAKSAKLSGYDVTQTSEVLLAYGIAGYGKGDNHFVMGLDVAGVPETLIVDPWIRQRADGSAFYTTSAHNRAMDGWDSTHQHHFPIRP